MNTCFRYRVLCSDNDWFKHDSVKRLEAIYNAICVLILSLELMYLDTASKRRVCSMAAVGRYVPQNNSTPQSGYIQVPHLVIFMKYVSFVIHCGVGTGDDK